MSQLTKLGNDERRTNNDERRATSNGYNPGDPARSSCPVGIEVSRAFVVEQQLQSGDLFDHFAHKNALRRAARRRDAVDGAAVRVEDSSIISKVIRQDALGEHFRRTLRRAANELP
jgi:hypothetical protein